MLFVQHCRTERAPARLSARIRKNKKEKPRFVAEPFPNQNNFIRRSFYGSEIFVKGGGGDTVVPSFCFYYMLFLGRIPPF